MNVASTVTREAIVTGLGLGAAATAAILASKGSPVEQVQLPTEHPAQILRLDSIAEEIQALEELESGQLQQIWDEAHTGNQTQLWTDEFVPMPSDLHHLWDESMSVKPTEYQWAEEFQANSTTTNPTVTMSASDFMTSQEQRLEQESQIASDWATQYEFEFNPNSTTVHVHDQWADELTGAQHQDQFLQKLQTQWDQQLAEDQAHSWLSLGTDTAFQQDYKFSPDNPFISSPNPMANGERLLQQGNIPQAVLAFEAAVQRNPAHIEAWVGLGKTQAQNEQDPKAISALNQAVKIQPTNLAALMALGASLTNEAFQLQAAQALKNWLSSNPAYSHLVPDGSQSPKSSRLSSVVSRDELKSIQDSFIQAARLNPTDSLDPDVQSGLGILFNLGNDYEKAADCFRSALSLRPNDSLLWNRLGATLANGGKSAEAISAYRRALELSPGFIRSRFNLGISCSNLSANKEAAEHFLTALNQQATGNESSLMSNSIWSSLRNVLPLMGRLDLVSAVDSRNLIKLNQELNLMS